MNLRSTPPSPSPTPQIRTIAARDCWALRQQILRPHQRIDEMDYPGDNHATTLHLGALLNDEIVCVASFYLEPLPMLKTEPLAKFEAEASAKLKQESPAQFETAQTYRLRGMATRRECQGRGIGAAVICAGIEMLRERGASSLWCNARTTAAGYYAKQEFTQLTSEPFDIPGIGPHFVMAKQLI